MFGYNFKFLNNYRKSKGTDSVTYTHSLLLRRLEVSLEEMAKYLIKGRVTHVCIWVSDENLPLITELMHNKRYLRGLKVRQTKTPNEFIVRYDDDDKLFA